MNANNCDTCKKVRRCLKVIQEILVRADRDAFYGRHNFLKRKHHNNEA